MEKYGVPSASPEHPENPKHYELEEEIDAQKRKSAGGADEETIPDAVVVPVAKSDK